MVDQLAQVARMFHLVWFTEPHPEPYRFPRPWDAEQAKEAPMRPSEFFQFVGKE